MKKQPRRNSLIDEIKSLNSEGVDMMNEFNAYSKLQMELLKEKGQEVQKKVSKLNTKMIERKALLDYFYPQWEDPELKKIFEE